MYCRKCGKQIDYDSENCKECQEMETFFSAPEIEPKFEVREEPRPQYTQPQYAYTQPRQPLPGNKKEGFGKALTSTILGSIGIVVALIAYVCLLAAMDYDYYYDYYYYDSYYYESMISVGVIFMLMSLGLAIPSLILGIKSMSCFFKQKREGKVKPVATLVLGIVGVATSALALLYASICFLVATAL